MIIISLADPSVLSTVCQFYNTPPPDGDKGSNEEETVQLPVWKKINKSKLAFCIDVNTSDFRDSVKSYLSQLKNFSRDPKEALRLLKASGGTPIFPEDFWTKILAGSQVDFDAVHKHLFGGSTVKSEAEWHRVWRTTSAAMAYAYSNRQTKLDSYYTYISNFFL
ncbi:hypothetical protein V5O48_012062 [Marasmius crinis-equi]|uniref:Uncharacterized protein n=1 Tax=Marasmius crinis-equi TaxID=585013 RepID=A0ABR3F3U4_9AGAR